MPDSRFPFSNFLPWEVEIGGIRYPTLEHAYQAHKTTDRMARLVIASHASPGQAKRLGGQLELRPGWDKPVPPDTIPLKLRVMRNLIRLKFAPGTEYARQLTLYQGPIVEWNTWHDVYWGKCTCDRHNGHGENHLGVMLETQRKRLLRGVL